MYIVTARQMQEMDKKTIEEIGIPGIVLMENASRGAAEFFIETFGRCKDLKVGVIAGKGNNGGDGFAAARYLYQKGIDVEIYLLGLKENIRSDAAINLKIAENLKIPVFEIPSSDMLNIYKERMDLCEIWIDAIFGTGLSSDVRGYFKEAIEYINKTKKDVFAIDIPSGLDSDTGKVRGVCICAKATASFAFAKVGHVVMPGKKYTGRLKIIDIGIPKAIADKALVKTFLNDCDTAKKGILPRDLDAHKGKSGHLLIIAGSAGKTGAAALCSMAALRAGAGLVTLACPDCINSIIETLCTEAMTYPLPSNKGMLDSKAAEHIIDLMDGKRCIAIGPGLGVSDKIADIIDIIIKKSSAPLVIDADGLNNLRPDSLKYAKAPIIITPHPGEMARLNKTDVSDIQENRIKTAASFSAKHNVYTVLKGVGTVIASHDGDCYLNINGNPGMAAAGMGDVLTGIIAGLMVQGADSLNAACSGVWIHGAAADSVCMDKGGRGYIASEVIERVPIEIEKLMPCRYFDLNCDFCKSDNTETPF